MSAVLSWLEKVYVSPESAWGVPVLPTAAHALPVMSLSMGPPETGEVRPRRDKAASRDMQMGFVEGRVQPIPFSLEHPILSRSAGDAMYAGLRALLLAGGLVEETFGGQVTYNLVSAPVVTPLSILSVLGDGASAHMAEHGRGGIIRQLDFSGGDTELMLRASGAFIGKHLLGAAAGTLQDAADTSLELSTPGHAARIGPGWYQIGAEVVRVTAVDLGTGILTVARAQAGTTAAAHTNAPIYPYQPQFFPDGQPISEANLEVSLNGEELRATRFNVAITTGVDFLPGESGSRYVQGHKVVRVDVQPTLDVVLTDETVSLLGQAASRDTCELQITAGLTGGGRFDIYMPTVEMVPAELSKPSNDITIMSIPFRVRGSNGNDSFSISFS